MWLSKKTNKLFFAKFANKVSARTPISSLFRGNNLKRTELEIELLKERLANSKNNSITVGGWNKKLATRQDLENGLEIISLLRSLTAFTIRVEGDTLGLYFNETERIKDFTSINSLRVREVFQPENEEIGQALLENPGFILRKEYTHKYKVTVNSLLGDADGFIQWAEKLPKIKLASKRYKYGGHFYVADEKTLSLCRLYLSNKIRKVEELVKVDEI